LEQQCQTILNDQIAALLDNIKYVIHNFPIGTKIKKVITRG